MDRPAPPDLPDEVANARPVFLSRRKAEQLPPLRVAAPSNGLEPGHDRGFDRGFDRGLARADWQSGFRWGVAATIGGLCLAVALIRGLA
jgi:hypothetical protein